MKFVERTTAPSADNKFYLKAGKGGYNRAMEINKKTHSCLANCVAMAHGRWLESQNQTDYNKYDKLPTGNAENYYPYTKDGYQRGKTPKLGAIICWRKGKAGDASDGAGHVAFVEKVYSNGDVLTSNSAYNGRRYYTKTYKKSNNYYLGSKYTFQGFIYNPCDFSDQFDLTRLLKKGCKGNDVKELQKTLGGLSVDGVFGNKTYQKVIAYQKTHKYNGKKLSVDGKVGKNTAHSLGWLWKGK